LLDRDGSPSPNEHRGSGHVASIEDLLASREFFKGIMDIAADAFISIDQGQRIILFNSGAERIFGYTAAEVLGQPLTLLLPEGSRPGHGAHVAQFGKSPIQARQMGERGSISGRRKDGSVFPAEASISRMAIGGRLVFTAILRDVTPQRQAEESIRRLNSDLEQRAMQLEAANRELEAFSYSVSHDLRAPLRTITGFAQVLVEDYADKLGEEGKDFLTRITHASRRMALLIDDLLGLSRLTRGTVNRDNVDLSAMARGVAEELRRDEPDRIIDLDIADGLQVRADPHLMRTVLVNLLSNAWKYTSKKPRAHVEFGATEHDGRRAFFVRDDGAGFDMAYAHKLFGAFQRLHGMKEFPGNGVGLATVQRIIHKHGGEVWADGAVGRGATFYFTLP
jgi:PAS domain S-box-containing protein